MSQVRRTDQAEADLLEIALFIAQDNVEAAHRLIDRIEEKCQRVARSPYMGRRRDELAPDLRSFPVGSYMLYYRPIKNGVEIIRVLHAARDVEALFEEE